MSVPIPVNSSAAPSAVGPYVHAVRHGDVLYCSGSLPLDPSSGTLDDGDLTSETRRSLSNLQAVCEAAGISLEHAVRTSVFTTRLDGFAEINEAYARFFADLGDRVPARTTVGVGALPRGARVEVDAIVAIVPGDGR